MNLNDYFDPIEVRNTDRSYIHPSAQLISFIKIHSRKNPIQDVSGFDLALISVPNTNNQSGEVEDYLDIRNELFSLSANKKIKLYDLGNLKPGKTKNDTIIGLRDAIIELRTNNITPILIGNSEDIMYAQYLVFQKLGMIINIATVDSRIAINENKEINTPSVLWKILVNEPESLSTFTNIGFQSYYINPKTLQFLTENHHLAYRIGYVRSNLKEAEPVFRDADLIGFNISSVRLSDAPGQNDGSPNGFYGEEICQFARYSGTSNMVSSLSIYNFDCNLDSNGQTSKLVAQMIWYFIEGFYQRIIENPTNSVSQFKKFMVTIDESHNELLFYKSEKTDRWWMEIPSLTDTTKTIIISCTYDDYLKATSGELPDRWLNVFQKINSK